MKRRDFLKAVFSTAFYFAVRKVLPDQQSDFYDVGVVRGKDYEKAVSEAIKWVGGINKYYDPRNDYKRNMDRDNHCHSERGNRANHTTGSD